MDLSNPQVIQNLLLIIILAFGIISIALNWRVSTPRTEPPPLSREQDEGWQRLFQQSELERARDHAECERENKELTIKLAARTAEVETLRALIDRLTTPKHEGVNVNVSTQGEGAQVGQTAVGTDIDQTKKK